MGKEPEVADAQKAGGNHMLKESRQESHAEGKPPELFVNERPRE
jgi:hypothetical protein